jgi:cytoskeletal protein CcmA (bactofilin family)
MTSLDLDLTPEPAPASPAVLAARHRRALVVGLGGGRDTDSPMAKSSFAERRLRSTDTAASRFVDPLPASAASSAAAVPDAAASAASAVTRASPSPAARLQLEDALVVPAGALIRGYLRCGALLLVGDVVGNIHCTNGPVVIRSGASLKGRLVASGDVYVCGTVGESAGGAVITTRGKLTLAPGARVDGDVRSGQLEVHEGAVLRGVAKRCED